MNVRENEAAIMQLLEPALRNYCKWKWTPMEMEDRVSEAQYVLLIILRRRGIPEEEIWSVFQRTVQEYMRRINAEENWHRYRCRSLDVHVRLANGSEGRTLHELIPNPQPDVYSLLEEIPDKQSS